ncbi:MAG: glycosyltransferase family A protein [Terriglobales bacterium]
MSVIIPSYNTAPLIATCLDSVFAQTFQDFEAIVVNDGSPDTEELEKVLQPYLGRIVYIKQVNKRAAGARNTAIGRARGEFLAFLDSDDTWLPNHLESQMKQFEADPGLGLVYANGVFIGGPTGPVEFVEKCPTTAEPGFEAIVVGRCQIPISTVVVRKTAIAKAGGFDESLARCDDWNMWLRTAFYGARIGRTRQVQARMADGRPGSLGASRAKMVEAYWLMLEKADRELPLSPAQRKLVRAQAAKIHARYLTAEGKGHLLARDVRQARERFSAANRCHRSVKLSFVLLGLKVAPNAASRLFARWAERRNDGASAGDN